MKLTEPRDLFPGALEMMVLRTLKRQPMHGYALVQHIQRASKDLLQVEEGSLYPALQRLLVNGWVSAVWGRTEGNRRARYYRLTASGRRQLEREVESYRRVTRALDRVLQLA